jgi:serine/threonine protein kinase
VHNKLKLHYCILMKYMPNAELFDFILNYGMSEEIAKFQFKSILLSVQILHNLGLVHLDIKPENIMIDEQYNMILCDLGSTNFCGSPDNKCLNIYCGTKEYSCPESLKLMPYNGQ